MDIKRVLIFSSFRFLLLIEWPFSASLIIYRIEARTQVTGFKGNILLSSAHDSTAEYHRMGGLYMRKIYLSILAMAQYHVKSLTD